jgi:GTPase
MQRVEQFLQDFGWRDKSFMISALSGAGCKELTYAIMEHLDATREAVNANTQVDADVGLSSS